MTTTTTKTVTVPVYTTITSALIKACHDQGLPSPLLDATTESGLPENAGWAFLRFTEGAAALIIQKSVTKVPQVHSHVDLSDYQGFIALPKKNGRVLCHFKGDATLMADVLHLFVGTAKRPVAAKAKAEVVAGAASLSNDSQETAAPVSYSEAEFAAEAEMYQTVGNIELD